MFDTGQVPARDDHVRIDVLPELDDYPTDSVSDVSDTPSRSHPSISGTIHPGNTPKKEGAAEAAPKRFKMCAHG
jgi:hypothetical protein